MQVLLEAQLEGLAHGADDALGEALTALQDVAGCGGISVRGVRVASAGWHSSAGPRPPPPDLTSLVDGILGYIGHVIRHVLQRDGGGGISWTRLGQPGRDAGLQLQLCGGQELSGLQGTEGTRNPPPAPGLTVSPPDAKEMDCMWWLAMIWPERDTRGHWGRLGSVTRPGPQGGDLKRSWTGSPPG